MQKCMHTMAFDTWFEKYRTANVFFTNIHILPRNYRETSKHVSSYKKISGYKSSAWTEKYGELIDLAATIKFIALNRLILIETHTFHEKFTDAVKIKK